MSKRLSGGPAQLVLTASVARRYYLEGRSKLEIADEFGISRFKVARLIDTARSSGLVRIEIGCPGVIDLDRSGRLRDAFGLRHAVVVDAPDVDAGSLQRHLATAAAELLAEIVSSDDVLGLAWSRSVSAMTAALTQLASVPIVQLTGVLSRPENEDNSVDLVRQAARISGGPAYLFYAPMSVSDAVTARALRQQPEVLKAFEQVGSVTKAVVGIGRWTPGLSTVYDATAEEDRLLLRHLGVRAEISGVFLGADGRPIRTELTDRLICISAAQLGAIPEVVGIAYDVAKAPAVRAALSSGFLEGLVTHTTLADALLSSAGRPVRERVDAG